MRYLYNNIISLFNTLQSKIAFYPTVLATFGFCYAFLMIYLEERGISKYILESIPALVVNNGDTALTILSVCITGLISMMVFSFSMVMVLLNQASSNYSPRLLPGLISDKNHQVILGIYLSTILYCIFIAVSIQPTGDKYQVPGFSVLMGIIFTVICIWAFIYFVHNISQSIQINNILDNIYHTAKSRLEALTKSEDDDIEQFEDVSSWHEYASDKTGYYQKVSKDNLMDICEDEDTQIQIAQEKGSFVLKGMPIFRSKKELDDTIVKRVKSNLFFGRGELVSDNYVHAFKQITEIIVKAMSPGINDPGTAINGIDYLTELFALRMLKKDRSFFSREDTTYLEVTTIDFENLLYDVMASIRTYCKNDIVIIKKLGSMFIYLSKQEAKDKSYHKIIKEQAKAVFLDAKENITNETDLRKIEVFAKKLQLEV